MRILARVQPAASDCVWVMFITKIIVDLEHIRRRKPRSCQARLQLGRRASRQRRLRRVPGTSATTCARWCKMRWNALAPVRTVIKAFLVAPKNSSRHENKTRMREMVTYMRKIHVPSAGTEHPLVLAFSLERVGDHARNVA